MTPQDRAREKRLADWFRLTPEDWQKIDDHQKHVCFICGSAPSPGRRLATDHDHKTGLIRGLLCARCNRILGKMENGNFTIQMILRVALYIQAPPATLALGEPRYGLPGRINTKKARKLLQKLKDTGVFNVNLNTPLLSVVP